MNAWRRFLLDHRRLAAGLVLLALAMKLLVPTGYMIGSAGGSITVELCSGTTRQTVTMAMPGMAHHGGDKMPEHGKAEMPCAFAGLVAPALGGADPLLLAVAIAFIVATVFRLPAPCRATRAPPHLRPPLRGPPLAA